MLFAQLLDYVDPEHTDHPPDLHRRGDSPAPTYDQLLLKCRLLVDQIQIMKEEIEGIAAGIQKRQEKEHN